MEGPRLLPRTGCAQPSRPAARSSKSDRQEWLPILPHIVPPSAPARGGQAASGQWRYGLLSSAMAPPCDVDLPQSNLPLGTSFASAGLFTPVLAMRAAGCSLDRKSTRLNSSHLVI